MRNNSSLDEPKGRVTDARVRRDVSTTQPVSVSGVSTMLVLSGRGQPRECTTTNAPLELRRSEIFKLLRINSRELLKEFTAGMLM